MAKILKNLPQEMLDKYNEKHVIQDDKYFYFYRHIAIDEKDRVLGIFNNSELRFNYADNFNDPYDCLFQFSLDIEALEKRDLEDIVGEKITDKDWTFNKPALLGASKKTVLDESRKTIDEIRKQTPITCFNSNPLSILMWSHYANHHKGIMIEFKIPKIEETSLFPLPVEYVNDYPVIKHTMIEMGTLLSRCEMDVELISKVFLRKSPEWVYEKEYRVIGKLSDHPIDPLLIKFDHELISSVIVGTRFKETGKLKLLQDVIKKFNRKHKLKMKIYEVKLMEDQYKLTVLGDHPRLSKKYFSQ